MVNEMKTFFLVRLQENLEEEGKKTNCRYKYLISFFMLFKKVNEGIRNGWKMSMNIGMK